MDLSRSLELIEQYRVTASMMVPTMFHRLLSLPDDNSFLKHPTSCIARALLVLKQEDRDDLVGSITVGIERMMTRRPGVVGLLERVDNSRAESCRTRFIRRAAGQCGPPAKSSLDGLDQDVRAVIGIGAVGTKCAVFLRVGLDEGLVLGVIERFDVRLGGHDAERLVLE